MHLPFTQSWADALCVVVNGDRPYREAAKQWRWPVALVLDPAAEPYLPGDTAVQLELRDGGCHGAAVVRPGEVSAPFVLRAGYREWKRVMLGEVDPIAAVLRGLVRLEGSLATLVMHTAAAKALVACARQVPTRFPDESEGG